MPVPDRPPAKEIGIAVADMSKLSFAEQGARVLSSFPNASPEMVGQPAKSNGLPPARTFTH